MILFRQSEFFTGIEPLLKDDFAVLALADVHRVRAFLQIIGHLLVHIDPDGLRAFSDWICSHLCLFAYFSCSLDSLRILLIGRESEIISAVLQ